MKYFTLCGVALGAVVSLTSGPAVAQAPAPRTSSITDVAGIRVGQVTLSTRPTGCTVVIADDGATGGVDVRGGAPGTRETDLLAPDNMVQTVNAIVLSGGSAFGLDAASGVMTYLSEQGIGFRTSAAPVPIVPAAILYDLNIGGNPAIRPDASCGYAAAKNAKSGAVEEGNVGAGAGATVGKMMGGNRAMKGGIGTASLTMTSGLVVGALIAVNAVGSVIDPSTGKPVAGVRTADGLSLENPFALIRRDAIPAGPARENTTIGVIATNARLTKAEALKVAEMAHDGLARAIVPAHTPSDGDTLFVLATGKLTTPASVGTVGQLSAEVVSDAILRAVRMAKGIPGYPGVAELR